MSNETQAAPAGPTQEATPESRGIGWPRLYDLLLAILTRGRGAAFRERILDLAGVTPGHSVLDVGCGTGTQAVAAWRRAQPDGMVAGTDISKPMLAAAERKARRAGADIAWRRADATALPFAGATFDIVTMTTVLHMVPEDRRGAAIAEMTRVLAPGGRLLIIDYAGDPRQRGGLIVRHGRHGRFDLHDWRGPVSKAGFKAMETGTLCWLELHYLRGTKRA